MSKDILFYSERCDYSMKVFNMIKDKSSMLKVCVDDPSIKLPSFVNAVPLIYIPKDKRVIVDDAVEMWIGTNFGSGNTSQSNNQLQSQNNATSFKNLIKIKVCPWVSGSLSKAPSRWTRRKWRQHAICRTLGGRTSSGF